MALTQLLTDPLRGLALARLESGDGVDLAGEAMDGQRRGQGNANMALSAAPPGKPLYHRQASEGAD